MLRASSVLGLATVLAGSFLGCKRNDAAPQPQCYSGTVVGFECGNGYLVQVDAQFPIGAPLRMPLADSIPVRPNIIAAINLLSSAGTKGQRIYFTFTNDPNQQTPAWACNAQVQWLPFPVPHLVLSNVSTKPCGTAPNE